MPKAKHSFRIEIDGEKRQLSLRPGANVDGLLTELGYTSEDYLATIDGRLSHPSTKISPSMKIKLHRVASSG
ncbi:MAG: hypothetical protein ABH829_05200 [archaeon]